VLAGIECRPLEFIDENKDTHGNLEMLRLRQDQEKWGSEVKLHGSIIEPAMSHSGQQQK
jgi:hypothetical protein